MYLLLYDVTDDKRLRKVHKTLDAWGEPVQYSAFRVRGTASELARLRFELARLMENEDRLLVVRLCASCASRVIEAGDPLVGWETDLPACRIVG
jgi:CRISPR-associated protein Cas2